MRGSRRWRWAQVMGAGDGRRRWAQAMGAGIRGVESRLICQKLKERPYVRRPVFGFVCSIFGGTTPSGQHVYSPYHESHVPMETGYSPGVRHDWISPGGAQQSLW